MMEFYLIEVASHDLLHVSLHRVFCNSRIELAVALLNGSLRIKQVPYPEPVGQYMQEKAEVIDHTRGDALTPAS